MILLTLLSLVVVDESLKKLLFTSLLSHILYYTPAARPNLSLKIFTPMYLHVKHNKERSNPGVQMNLLKCKLYYVSVLYLPIIMTVACGFVPGDLDRVDPSITRRPEAPITLYCSSTTLPTWHPPW